MPNWVYNGLTIEGSPDQINKLVEQVNKPFVQNIEANGDLSFNVKQIKYINPIFAFHNIYNHRDAGISDEDYQKQPARSELDVNDPNWWSDTQRLAQIDSSWYSWNNTNWGTKWDVAVSEEEKYPETYIEGPTPNGENLVVYYNFNTAWSVPILLKLSAQYPTLLMTLSYEEETGWGGEMEFLRGEIISESEYGWQCRECEHQEPETPYCEDCEYDTCPACGYNEADEMCGPHGELWTKNKVNA